MEVGPLLFLGITCNSTGNTRLGRELVHKQYPTIIILPDPCHQLHNAVKDITKLDYFQEIGLHLAFVFLFWFLSFSVKVIPTTSQVFVPGPILLLCMWMLFVVRWGYQRDSASRPRLGLVDGTNVLKVSIANRTCLQMLKSILTNFVGNWVPTIRSSASGTRVYE